MEQEHSKNDYRHWLQEGRNVVGEKMQEKNDMRLAVSTLLTQIFKSEDFDHPLETHDPKFFEILIQCCVDYFPQLKVIHREAIQYDAIASRFAPGREQMFDRHLKLMLEIRREIEKRCQASEISIQECFKIQTSCEKSIVEVPLALDGPVRVILKESNQLNTVRYARPKAQTAHADRLIRFIFWLLRWSDGAKTDHTTVAGIKFICECAYEAKGNDKEYEFRDKIKAANIEMANFDELKGGYFTHPFLQSWGRFQEAVAAFIPTKSENGVLLLKSKTDQLLGASVIWNAYDAFKIKTKSALAKQSYHQILHRILVGDTFPMQNTMQLTDDDWSYKIVPAPEGGARESSHDAPGSEKSGTSADFAKLSLGSGGDTASKY